MKKTLAVFAAVVAGTVLLPIQSVEAGTPRPYAWHVPTQPCKYEDSRNCFWDAGIRGNKSGHSFWVGRNGKVHFLSPRLGR